MFTERRWKLHPMQLEREVGTLIVYVGIGEL